MAARSSSVCSGVLVSPAPADSSTPSASDRASPWRSPQVAGSVHWAAGLWAQNGGFELPLLYITGATTLGFTGSGVYSLDNALGLHALAGNGWGVAALVVGALSGLAVVARGRRALAADATAQSVSGDHVPA
jgi:hypothetical protein